MTPFHLILLVTMLNHISFKGSKVLMSLFAIELGANPLMLAAGGWLMRRDARTQSAAASSQPRAMSGER